MKQIRTKLLIIVLTCFIVITSASLTVLASDGQGDLSIELKEKKKDTIIDKITGKTTDTSSETTTPPSQSPKNEVPGNGGKGGESQPSGVQKILPQTSDTPTNRGLTLSGFLFVVTGSLILWYRKKSVNE